jgi:Spy/CpxP family protein refolding chaperone
MRNPIRCLWLGLLSLTIVQAAAAQGGLKDLPPGKWWANKRVIAQLKLTSEQQSKIDALWVQNRRGLIDQKAELERCQLDLTELAGKELIDEALALRAFDRWQEAKHAIERSTFLMRVQIKNALSAEQQQQLETISVMLREQRARAGNASPATQAVPSAKKGSVPIKK